MAWDLRTGEGGRKEFGIHNLLFGLASAMMTAEYRK
jgi:hypothetical protein